MDIAYYRKYEPIFGAWSIVRQIGEGSYGKVFEIRRSDIGGTYEAALKVITIPQTPDEIESLLAEGMDRAGAAAYFQSVAENITSEFSLMSKLKGNSNIVSYEDHTLIRHQDGIGWDILIRMELLTPLLRYIRENALTQKDVIRLGIDLCRALELCRKYNILHRDIKPENIFVSASGDYKLGDFGIARTIEKTTGGLSKKGTYTYMAPEVYCGQPYGFAADIYSLGIVMYRLLNDNRTPFLPSYPASVSHDDQESALARRIGGEPLPPPKNAGAGLWEIVRRACAFAPHERYTSPGQMRLELEAILYSREEARLIYPGGDEVPIRSIDYIRTGAADGGRTQTLTGGGTAAGTEPLFRGGERTETRTQTTARTAGTERTQSIFGGTASVRDGTARTESIFGASADFGKTAAAKTKTRRRTAGAWIACAVTALALAGCGLILWRMAADRQTAARETQYESLLKQAEQYEQTAPDEALSLLEQAYTLLPARAEAYDQTAYCLYQSGQYDACVKFCTEHPQGDQMKLIQASACFETQDYESAAGLYYEVSQNDKAELSTENLRDYSVCLGRLGRLDEAAAIFVMLTDKGATPDVTDYVLGETYYAKKDYANAEKSFLSALDRTTDDTLTRRIYMSLAETYRDSGEYEKSIRIIRQAQSLPQLQNNAVLCEMLGAAYYAEAGQQDSAEDYRSAAESFEQVIALGVQKDYLYVNAYAAWVKAKEYGRAEDILGKMEVAFPKDYTPHALRATLLIMEENEKDETVRDYSAAYQEYQLAKSMATSQDDQTQLQQLEGLITQLKDGGWLTEE